MKRSYQIVMMKLIFMINLIFFTTIMKPCWIFEVGFKFLTFSYHIISVYDHEKFPLQWRDNDLSGVSNHQPHGCLLNRLFRRRSKKTSKLRVRHWPLCGEFTRTGEFPTQRASYAENVSIWWRHHAIFRRSISGEQCHFFSTLIYQTSFSWTITLCL